jgi:DNA-binding NarL/FixJ family response regulator
VRLAEAEDLLSDPRQRADAALARAQSLLFTRPPEEAVEVARRAARELPPDLADRRLALDAMATLGLTTFGAAGVGEPAARYAGPPDGPGSAMLAAVTAWQDSLTGATAAACADRALAALAGGDLVVGDCLFAASAVTVLVLAEREEALTWLDAIEREGHRRGSHFAVNAALLFRGRAWLARGELDDAEASLRKSAELAVLWGGDPGWEAPELAAVQLARGDLAGAEALIGSVRPLSAYSEATHGLRRVHTELLLARGSHAEALVAADELTAHLRTITNPAFVPWRSLRGLALAGLGRTAEAVELVREELPHVERWGAPGALARTLRVLGTLERDVDRLAQAVAALDGSSARLERARSLHALGGALRRARRPAESREPLAEALELSDRCGSVRLSEQVRAELYAAGGRPRVTAVAGPTSLTASERRVAELAATGRTNKEIAQALFVTVKTVEAHLSRAYRKLGVTTRREVGNALTG